MGLVEHLLVEEPDVDGRCVLCAPSTDALVRAMTGGIWALCTRHVREIGRRVEAGGDVGLRPV